MGKNRIKINDIGADHLWSLEELAEWRVTSINRIYALENFAETVWQWFQPGSNSVLDIYANPIWQEMKKKHEGL